MKNYLVLVGSALDNELHRISKGATILLSAIEMTLVGEKWICNPETDPRIQLSMTLGGGAEMSLRRGFILHGRVTIDAQTTACTAMLLHPNQGGRSTLFTRK